MKIFVTSILGSPAAECAHFGICQVDEIAPEQWDSFQPQHARHVKAILSLSKENGMLRFEFPFSGMRAGTRRKFFPPAGFRVDSPGRLPDRLAATLGTEAQIIVPGLYDLFFSMDATILEVALRREALTVPSQTAPIFSAHPSLKLPAHKGHLS